MHQLLLFLFLLLPVILLCRVIACIRRDPDSELALLCYLLAALGIGRLLG